MKRIAWGIVAGGAAAAALTGTATANADPASWIPDYDIDDAAPYQNAGSSSVLWKLPATFTGGNGTVLTGTDWVTQTLSFGQFVHGYDNEFITNTGALYDQHQLAPDFTNFYYYDPSVPLNAVDFLQTPLGTFDVSWNAPWVFEPMDYVEHATAPPSFDLADAGLYSALDLGLAT